MLARQAVKSICIITLFCLTPYIANAQVFAAHGLDQSFCNDSEVRQTIIYVDDMGMKSGDVGWAQNLENKLQATLMPGEVVSVIRLSPTTGTSTEMWSACWPDYTSADKAKLAAGTYLFSTNPLKTLATQQAIFINEFLHAITAIYTAAKDTPGEASVPANNPPTKEIIGALSSDNARFSQSNLTNRVIVYSDLAENSTVANVFAPLPSPFPNIGQMLGLQFHNGVFYFFGVGSDVSGAPNYLPSATTFWRQVLQSTGGSVGGIGSTLNIPDAVPVTSLRARITIMRDNQSLTGLLSLLKDSDGNLIDSWLSVARLTTTSITGTYTCGSGETSCALHAKTDTGVTILNVNENIDMTGASASSLSGTIGVPGNLTFPISVSSLNSQ